MAFIKIKDCLSDPRQSVKLILVVMCICITIFQLSQCVTKLIHPPITSYYKFRYNETIEYPALTICRRPGYKIDLFQKFGVSPKIDYEHSFRNFDFKKSTLDEFVNATTYSFPEFIPLFGFKGTGWINNFIKENTLLATRGLCHTIIPNETVNTFSISSGYYMYLKHTDTEKSKDPNGFPTTGFEIYIHNRYDVIVDEQNIPYTCLYLEPGEEVQATISLQTYSEISTSQQPCVSDPTYSESKCLEKCFHNRVASKIGCTVPWLRGLESHYPPCSNSSSMNKLWAEFNHNHKRQFLKTCECLTPCNNSIYRYQIESRKDTDIYVGPSSSLINIYIPTNLFIELTEVISYDWNVFLADIGGSLGFLLGLSVIGVITVIEEIIKMIFGKRDDDEVIDESEDKLPQLAEGENLKSIMEFVANCDMYQHLQKEEIAQFEEQAYM